MTYFELKDNGAFLKIELTNFAYPDADMDWDKNWINSTVMIKSGGFSGQFNCYLMTTDFKRFKNELSELYSKLKGNATFNTLEGQVSIKIKGDGFGHFKANCLVLDDAGGGNKLEFEIDFDQTIIPEMVKQLEIINQVFPVSGELNIEND